jgi:hypothetical protein
MCRNIRVLHHFKPPSTEAEIRAAALQFVRKVSGLSKPRLTELALLERSAAVVAAETRKLLKALPKHGEPRTRESEIEKARARWAKREEQMFARLHAHGPHGPHTHPVTRRAKPSRRSAAR